MVQGDRHSVGGCDEKMLYTWTHTTDSFVITVTKFFKKLDPKMMTFATYLYLQLPLKYQVTIHILLKIIDG